MGSLFSRMNANTSDYFRSGQRGTWWLVGMSLVMASTSTSAFTGNAGVGYEAGFTFFIIYWSWLVILPLECSVLAPMFRRLRATTTPEVICERFGFATEQIVAAVRIITFILYGGAWLWGLAIFVGSVFGFPTQILIVILGLVVIFYSTTGGKWAVMGTDFIQGLIMISMCLLLGYLCLREFGGAGGMIAAIKEQGLWQQYLPVKSKEMSETLFDGKYNWSWAAALFVAGCMWRFSMGAADKLFSVKDEREAKRVMFMGGIAGPILSVFFLIPDIASRLLYSDQVMSTSLSKPAESAFAIASINLLPQGLIGMMVIAMFAACMSSLDTGMNSNAAMIIKNIYPRLSALFKMPLASEKKLLWASRVLSVVLGAIIISVALYLSNIKGMGMFEILMDTNAILSPPLVVPMVLGLFIRKAPKCAGLVSLACGVTVGLVSLYFANQGTPWSYPQKVFTILGVSVTAFLATMPFYRFSSAAYKETVERFFIKKRTPIDFEKEVGEPNDQHQMAMLGTFACILGVFVLCLCAIPGNDLQGRMYIAFVALMILSVGIPMLYLGRKRVREEQRNEASLKFDYTNAAK